MKKTEIVNLAIEGMRPFKIAAHVDLTLSEIVETLKKAILNHEIKRSQVLATFENEMQNHLSVWLPTLQKILDNKTQLETCLGLIKEYSDDCINLTFDELNLYLLCNTKGFRDGEVYELLCDIERTLHTKIRSVLFFAYGENDAAWWKKGIPKGVRLECVERMEKRDDAGEYPPYGLITLGELSNIIDFEPNASHFKKKMPLSSNGKIQNLKQVKIDLIELTRIRNKVMHPVGATPTTEDEYFFVMEMQKKFQIIKWR